MTSLELETTSSFHPPASRIKSKASCHQEEHLCIHLDMLSRKVIGKYLETGRKKAGITQSELANILGYTSPQIVSNWERAICLPPMAKLRQILELTKLDKEEYLKLMLFESEQSLNRYFENLA